MIFVEVALRPAVRAGPGGKGSSLGTCCFPEGVKSGLQAQQSLFRRYPWAFFTEKQQKAWDHNLSSGVLYSRDSHQSPPLDFHRGAEHL